MATIQLNLAGTEQHFEIDELIMAVARSGTQAVNVVMDGLAAADEQLATSRRIKHRKPLKVLSEREREVLILVANGYSRKEVGSCLGITQNTSAAHIASIYRKLDISTVAEATAVAFRSGLIE